jgi:hypothetical protein
VASGLHVLVGQGHVRLASKQTDGRDGDRAALTRVAHPIPMEDAAPMTKWEGSEPMPNRDKL